jgi:hypothetical protein
MERILKCFSDPSHAWINVKREELKQLGIEQSISRCSYQEGDDIYLEEDCDAQIFIDALKKQGHTIKFDEIHTEYESAIRRFNSFRPSSLKGALS